MLGGVATVARISIAPVKALGLVFPDEVELGPHGVSGDRRFWLVDADGRLFDNKRCDPRVLVRPAWDEQSGRPALSVPDCREVAGTVDLGPEADLALSGDPFPAWPVLGPWDAPSCRRGCDWSDASATGTRRPPRDGRP